MKNVAYFCAHTEAFVIVDLDGNLTGDTQDVWGHRVRSAILGIPASRAIYDVQFPRGFVLQIFGVGGAVVDEITIGFGLRPAFTRNRAGEKAQVTLDLLTALEWLKEIKAALTTS